MKLKAIEIGNESADAGLAGIALNSATSHQAKKHQAWYIGFVSGLVVTTLLVPVLWSAQQNLLHIEEASIGDIQNTNRSGKTTWEDVVRAYLARVKNYNGAGTALYTREYVLSADKTKYTPVTGQVESKLPHPMPIRLMVWSGPVSDGDVIKVASAYEAATHHRVPPPEFGSVPGVDQSMSH